MHVNALLLAGELLTGDAGSTVMFSLPEGFGKMDAYENFLWVRATVAEGLGGLSSFESMHAVLCCLQPAPV